ncbi:MAG: hypothetical protein LIO87_02625 [Eubacterium sp.]|nr:hypothetical protein [Eubacterium sp.]
MIGIEVIPDDTETSLDTKITPISAAIFIILSSVASQYLLASSSISFVTSIVHNLLKTFNLSSSAAGG